MDEEIDFPLSIVNHDGSVHEMTSEEATSFWSSVKQTTDYLSQRDGKEAWKAAREELNRTVPGLEIERMGGYAPVQAYGTYEGEECYFRARYQHASFAVGTYDEDGNVTGWMAKRKAEAKVSPDDDPFGAGYLSPAQCVVIIREFLIPNLEERTQEQGEAELQEFSDLVHSIADQITRAREENEEPL